jgi:hypothetical protein
MNVMHSVSNIGGADTVHIVHGDLLLNMYRSNKPVSYDAFELSPGPSKERFLSISSMLKEKYNMNGLFFGNDCIFYTEERDTYVKFVRSYVEIQSTRIDAKEIKDFILESAGARLINTKIGVYWFIDEQTNPRYLEVSSDRLPVTEMYPWLNGRELHDFYDDFMNSNANILLLMGPPGTGKTSFIRGLMHHSVSSSYLTYNAQQLLSDYAYVSFFQSNSKLFILEDADNFLKPRSEGNEIMSKFLNLGDGLVSSKDKKFIFSTNLEDITKIDSALTRNGRCFEVLKFDYLDETQAKTLASKMNVPLKEREAQYTISDVFNKPINQIGKSPDPIGFGFC